jgi:predicted  nucleic acid-binding Zn-ribbon protein
MEKVPIRVIDENHKGDKNKREKMTALVDQMLTFSTKMADIKTDHEKKSLQRQIDATDQQIDQLVYELYGLKEEEIAMISG